MSEVSEATRKQSIRTAVAAVAVVAVLSLAFIGLVSFLDGIAEHAQGDDAPIGAITSEEPFYVLLIGSDSRKGTALYTGKRNEHAQLDQHSDIMTLMRVDPGTYTITLVTIPRDTQLQGTSGKINDSLLSNDPEETVAAAEKLTGVQIDSYMMTTFTSFQALIDGMGGITVDVPQDIKVPDPLSAEEVTVKAGEDKTLTGSEALVLARARKEYGANQDALRQVNVRNLEVAMIQKVLDLDSEKKANSVLIDLEENTSTNLDMASIGYLVVDFIAHKEEVTVYSSTGPYEGGENADGLWVVKEDPNTWRDLMEVVDAGGDPSSVVEPPRFSQS